MNTLFDNLRRMSSNRTPKITYPSLFFLAGRLGTSLRMVQQAVVAQKKKIDAVLVTGSFDKLVVN